jgi:hypothetical protein
LNFKVQIYCYYYLKNEPFFVKDKDKDNTIYLQMRINWGFYVED